MTSVSRVSNMRKKLNQSQGVDEIKKVKDFSCEDMVLKANNCLKQAEYSYGKDVTWDKSTEYIIARLKISVKRFEETHNHAHLVDILNWIRIIWVCDTHSRAHYEDTDGSQYR